MIVSDVDKMIEAAEALREELYEEMAERERRHEASGEVYDSLVGTECDLDGSLAWLRELRWYIDREVSDKLHVGGIR